MTAFISTRYISRLVNAAQGARWVLNSWRPLSAPPPLSEGGGGGPFNLFNVLLSPLYDRSDINKRFTFELAPYLPDPAFFSVKKHVDIHILLHSLAIMTSTPHFQKSILDSLPLRIASLEGERSSPRWTWQLECFCSGSSVSKNRRDRKNRIFAFVSECSG